jgi:tetratricopeptide (TPR) repeat protein/tRNA A-37 threonylcarbamoyl transferase component Bud32
MRALLLLLFAAPVFADNPPPKRPCIDEENYSKDLDKQYQNVRKENGCPDFIDEDQVDPCVNNQAVQIAKNAWGAAAASFSHCVDHLSAQDELEKKDAARRANLDEAHRASAEQHQVLREKLTVLPKAKTPGAGALLATGGTGALAAGAKDDVPDTPRTPDEATKSDSKVLRQIQAEHPDTQVSPESAKYFQKEGEDYAASKGAEGKYVVPFAGAALHANDPKGAEALASKAIDLGDRSADPFAIRGAARLSLGNLSGARDDSQQAVSLDPGNRLAASVVQFAAKMERDPSAKPPDPSRLIRDFGSSSAGSLAGGARGASSPGTVIGGGNVASLGGERAGGASFAAMTPSNKLAAEAEGSVKIGDLKTALLQATKAIEADKSNPEAYAVRAGIWNKQERYLNAQADANMALSFDPNHHKALNARAFAYNMTGHPQEAQADATKVLSQDPRDALGCLNLAMSQEALGDLTRANENYQKAAAFDPSYKPLYEDFLSKHPELLGGGAVPASGTLKLLPPVLRTPSGAAGAAVAALGLGAAALAFRRRKSGDEELEEDAPAPAPVRPKPATQGAETIPLPPGTRRAEAAPTLIPGRSTGRTAGAATPVGGTAVGPNGGQLIARTYEIRKELGRGGMGVVYEAFDTSLSRKVAIKEMRSEIAQSARDKERFLAEARTVAKFQHPNIVSIFAILEDAGRTFLVFEHVQGGGLDGILDQRRKLGPDAAVPLLHSIAAALDYSHSRKVIHRDLKPSNIMITDEGVVKVMDFGIAHEAKQTVSRLTNAEAFGTMAYMPPEQELGQASRESDVFAFAVLAYETLVGTIPFPGPNFLEQKKGKMFKRPSQADPTLPAALDAVFEKALEPEPQNRYKSAGQFATAVGAAFGIS